MKWIMMFLMGLLPISVFATPEGIENDCYSHHTEVNNNDHSDPLASLCPNLSPFYPSDNCPEGLIDCTGDGQQCVRTFKECEY